MVAGSLAVALICGFAAVFGAAAPAGAATESFALTSASLPGQSSVTWQGPPVTPPSTPNVFPSTVSLSGQIDPTTGDISGATLSLPPIPQPEQSGAYPVFTFSEVSPGTATGNFDSTTGAVTLNDTLTLTFTTTGIEDITCVSTPIDVAFSGTWDSTTEDVTLAASGFTIPNFVPGNAACGLASTDLNASPGGTAGAVGNAFSLALNGQFAPGLPTTTTLAVSPNGPQPAGTSVTMTATVTDPSGAGTPAGNVSFLNNGVEIGTEALSPGGTTGTATAAFSTTTLPGGTNQLSATYTGSTTYAASSSTAQSYVVQAKPTITSTFPSSIVAGSTSFPTPTPFTLTVSNPSGGANYANLYLYLGFNSGNGFGPSQIQLSYQDQAGNWCPLTLGKSAVPPSGQQTNATVYFSGLGTPPCGFSSSFALAPGASMTLNMEVSFNQAPHENDPATGQLLFQTALATGTCTSATSCTATAPLSGSAAPTSQAASTVVPPDGPGTIPSMVSPAGNVTSGATIRSTYTLFPGALVGPTSAASTAYYIKGLQPTGNVQFYLDGQLLATQVLSNYSGNDSDAYPGYMSPALAPGTHTEIINYPGDQNYTPSSVTIQFTVIAGPPPGTPYVCAVAGIGGATTNDFDAYVTATSGSSVPATTFSGTSITVSGISVTLDVDAEAGSAATFTGDQDNQVVTFSPGNVAVNSGPITFTDSSPDTDTIGTVSGLSATVTVGGNPGDTVPIGVGSISFGFGGILGQSVSCRPVSQAASVGTVAIIGTTLAGSPSGSAPAGAPVTLTATVAPLLPAVLLTGGLTNTPGQVDFYDGSTYLATAAVSSTTGTATFTTSNLAVGDHQFTADWSGYSGVPPSTSNTVDYAVGTATTTALASSANPANTVNPITYTATVSPPLGALTQPTGDVSFTQDGNPITTCQDVSLSTDSPPTATCQVSFGAGESHVIVATYSGDGTYLPSTSDPLTQTTLPGTNTTVLSTKDPSPPGNVTFWAGVSPSSGTGATPTGTVAFNVDGKTLTACSAQPLGSGGGASCTVSFKAGTTHKVSATYPGSATYSGSTSNTITQTVTGSSSSTKPKASAGNATLASGKALTSGQSLTAGAYRLTMQADGNLVEYQGTKVLWASGTSGHPGAGVTMQKNGNLAIYSQGKAIWASKTAGHAGAHLTLQATDGNVVVYGPGGRALWATGT